MEGYVGAAILSPAYAAAIVDGPLPFGDVLGIIGAAVLTAGAVGYGIYQASKAISASKAKEEEKAVVVPLPPSTKI